MTPQERTAEVCRTWGLLHNDGGVREIRSLKNGACGTIGGYFDDGAALTGALKSMDSKIVGNVFITLNPVKPELLARCVNRLDRNVQATTTDADIARRAWLLIDCDPKRPAGISATDEEHDLALERSAAIRSFFVGYGLHTILADSGNGGHNLLPIDLPNDDASRDLLAKVLEALASLFDDERVEVDTTTFNAARISKLYGTQARKGDSTPDRPHRYAHILEVPDDLTPAPLEALQQIAALLPVPQEPAAPVKGTSRPASTFDLGQWVAAHGIAIHKRTPYKDGERWQLAVCPFNAEHSAPDAALYLFTSGKIGFKCSHKSCAGNHWREFRLHYEPTAYDRKNTYEKVREAKAALAEDADGEAASGGEDADTGPYAETTRGIVRLKPTTDGPAIAIPLTNFCARIVATVTIDNGAETSLSFDIEARRHGRNYAFSVPAKDFAPLNWVIEKMGPQSIVHAGMSAKDHTRVGIQTLSGVPAEHYQYEHTGWRQIGEQWVYLHGDGWIGGVIPGSVSVALEGAMAGYRLPPVADEATTREAVRASLRMLELAKPEITYPLYTLVWRAAIETCDFAAHITGATQSGKSTVAALAQQHFGATMNARRLPASWGSTANALTEIAFTAKDALLTVDDFVPKGTTYDVQKLNALAEQVLRAQGNNAGRSRMRDNATLRAARPPRGLILSTGEDIPPGESLRARMLIVELARGDLKVEVLKHCQADADAGLYAQAMTGFLAWLAPQYEKRRKEVREATVRMRDDWGQGEMLRTPDILANLAAGFHLFLSFAMDCGAITEKDAHTLNRTAVEALRSCGEAQTRHQSANEPARRFVDLTRQAIVSGKAYLTSETDGQPFDPAACGWRKEPDAHGDYFWKAMGDRIGWITGDDVYLLPEAAYNVARRMGEVGGEGISIAPRTLAKRLRERGYLSTTDTTRGTSTVRKVFGGAKRDVLHFNKKVYVSEPADKTDKTDTEEDS
jgi:hypothetical protein